MVTSPPTWCLHFPPLSAPHHDHVNAKSVVPWDESLHLFYFFTCPINLKGTPCWTQKPLSSFWNTVNLINTPVISSYLHPWNTPVGLLSFCEIPCFLHSRRNPAISQKSPWRDYAEEVFIFFFVLPIFLIHTTALQAFTQVSHTTCFHVSLPIWIATLVSWHLHHLIHSSDSICMCSEGDNTFHLTFPECVYGSDSLLSTREIQKGLKH